MIRNAMVIGASSGIGRALALQLCNRGYRVAVAARRMDELRSLAGEHANITATVSIDLRLADKAREQLSELLASMGQVDLLVIAAGTGAENRELDWKTEAETIEVNVNGFVAMATMAMNHFEKQGCGHLVAMSSIAAIRGHGDAPAYGASKAFTSSYLCSLRHRCQRSGRPITVTEVQPGFVDTRLAIGDNLFWVASVDKAARQIMRAIEAKKSHLYVTRRWRFIAWLMKILPDWLYARM